MTRSEAPVIAVMPPRTPGSRVMPIKMDGPRGFPLHQRVIADDGASKRPGRIIWDGRDGWAVLLDGDGG